VEITEGTSYDTPVGHAHKDDSHPSPFSSPIHHLPSRLLLGLRRRQRKQRWWWRGGPGSCPFREAPRPCGRGRVQAPLLAWAPGAPHSGGPRAHRTSSVPPRAQAKALGQAARAPRLFRAGWPHPALAPPGPPPRHQPVGAQPPCLGGSRQRGRPRSGGLGLEPYGRCKQGREGGEEGGREEGEGGEKSDVLLIVDAD